MAALGAAVAFLAVSMAAGDASANQLDAVTIATPPFEPTALARVGYDAPGTTAHVALMKWRTQGGAFAMATSPSSARIPRPARRVVSWGARPGFSRCETRLTM